MVHGEKGIRGVGIRNGSGNGRPLFQGGREGNGMGFKVFDTKPALSGFGDCKNFVCLMSALGVPGLFN